MQAQYDGTFIKLEQDFQQCSGIGTLCPKYSSRGAEGVKRSNTLKWQEHKHYNTRLLEFNVCKCWCTCCEDKLDTHDFTVSLEFQLV